MWPREEGWSRELLHHSYSTIRDRPFSVPGGSPSCPPIIYPIWADQLSNQHIAEPVYNNSNQTVPVIGVDGGGLWGAIVGGMVAGVIAAAVAGNAGPQAFVPEEIVTVPVSVVVGAIGGVVGFVTN